MQHRKSLASRAWYAAKRNWRLVATGTVATGAILTLAASSATAAGLIGRGDLTDTLRKDINNVWKSEIRFGGDLNNVYESELSSGVTKKLNAPDETGTSTSVTDMLEASPAVPADAADEALETLDVAAGSLVTANVTLVGENHAVCFLAGPDGAHLAESDTQLGGGADHVTLTGVTDAAGTVSLLCHVGDGEGTATDISMAAVN